jgi:hypothetical protein
MTAPIHLIREAMIEAVLAEAHGEPVRAAGELLTVAETELLLLVAELDDPRPATTAERRKDAIRLVAHLARSRRSREGVRA